MNDFLIVGGGVIGMMTARTLADSGADVTIIDKGELCKESSWAGGGIVSPLYPWRYRPEITALANWSQGYYPELAKQLAEETGIDPEFRSGGMLMLRVEDEAEALAWADKYQQPLHQVDQDFIYSTEANIAPGKEQAIWMPEVGSIRNPRLGQALKRSLELRPNVRILEHVEVKSIRVMDGQAIGVNTNTSVLSAGQVIVCSGAWSSGLLRAEGQEGENLLPEFPIEPVRGQMMVYKAEPGLVDRVVMLDGRYVIPRNDGRILVGSTLEYDGFNKQTTEEARQSLQASAEAILPALKDIPVEHHWCGLRPGSPDGVPFIGAVEGIGHLHINAGHFRNGLVLAPAATELLCNQLLGQQTIIDPAPYQPKARLEEKEGEMI